MSDEDISNLQTVRTTDSSDIPRTPVKKTTIPFISSNLKTPNDHNHAHVNEINPLNSKKVTDSPQSPSEFGILSNISKPIALQLSPQHKSTEDSISKKTGDVIDEEENSGSKQELVQTGQGRPKKVEIMIEGDKSELESESEPDNNKPKRGRGRPKKSIILYESPPRDSPYGRILRVRSTKKTDSGVPTSMERERTRTKRTNIDESVIDDGCEKTIEPNLHKRSRGRPKLSDEEKRRRLMERFQKQKEEEEEEKEKEHQQTIEQDRNKPQKKRPGRPRLSLEEKQERKRQRLGLLLNSNETEKIVEPTAQKFSKASVIVSTLTDDFDSNNDSDRSINEEKLSNISMDSESNDSMSDDSDEEFGKSFSKKLSSKSKSKSKSKNLVSGSNSVQKCGRGRPKLSEEEKLKRATLRELGLLHSNTSMKIQKKEIQEKKLGELVEIDQEDYEIDELGDDSDAEVTNFVFISNPKQLQNDRQKNIEDEMKTPITKEKRMKIIQKNIEVVNAEIFETPKKKKMGLLNLPTVMRTPSKKGIFKLNMPKTPNGRSGVSRILNFSHVDTPTDYTIISDLEMEVRNPNSLFSFSESPKKNIPHQSRSTTPQSLLTEPTSLTRAMLASTSSKSKHGLPFNIPDFQPMALPSSYDDEQFFDGKYSDQSLFLDGPDGYFDQHKMKNTHSNNSMVQAPQLEYDEFNSLVLLSGFLHHQQKFNLLQKYKKMYSQYYFELSQGFNLLFYGVGSKRHFIENFVQEYLLERIEDENIPVLVINGYNPATTLKEILTKVVQTLKLSKAPKATVELIEFLHLKYSKKSLTKPSLILILHNIDGPSLRDDKTQNYLSKLSSIPEFQLLTSVDHLFSPLLWNSARVKNFNFLWHKISTYMDYLIETSFEDPLILGQTQKSAGSKGAKFVLSSLTENSKALYRVLASNQLQNMEDDLLTKRDQSDTTLKGTLKHGLLFSQFFSLCAEEFISSNELNFRSMLMEFVEHKMCVLSKDQAGIEKVFIPFTLAEISKLLTDELL